MKENSVWVYYTLRDTPNYQEDVCFNLPPKETVEMLLKEYGEALAEVYYETDEGELVWIYTKESK